MRLAIVDETPERNDLMKRLTALHRVFEQNLATYKGVQDTIQRRQGQLAQSRFTIRRYAPPHGSIRGLHLLISGRIDEGRLPSTACRTALASGFGGACAACDGYLPSTQLVRAILKDETFVYLHADCYAIWQAQCQMRAALQRYESLLSPNPSIHQCV